MSTEATTTEVTQPASSTETTTETQPTSLVSETKPEGEVKPEAAPEFTPVEASALKFPEGSQTNEAITAKFLEITNGAKLPAEAVQQLVDLQANLAKEASEAGSKLWTETQAKWQDEVRADAEIGGQKLEENLSHVAKLIDRVSGDQAPAVREAFAMTGAGNHPALVKFMVKVAKELSEPAPVAGAPGNVSRDTASLLFPSSNGTK